MINSEPSVTIRKITPTLVDVFWGPEWANWARLKIKSTGAKVFASKLTFNRPLDDLMLSEITQKVLESNSNQ